MIYFTSDLHFGHLNVIKYDNRPFSSIEEMDEALIQNWNSVVTNKDIVYLLGDVSFHKPIDTINILNRLNGHIHLIKGNHDNKNRLPLERFMSVNDLLEVSFMTEKIVLCHFPLRSWNKMHHGTWHLHGHCHGSIKAIGRSLDVGTSCNDYRPISFLQVKQYMDNRTFERIDHHTDMEPQH